jgi:hypothetical protein
MLELILDWQEKEFDFKGSKITAELRPLKRRAMMALLPFMQGGEITNQRALEMQGLAEKIFPDHVRNISGIRINGQPITVEQLNDEMALFSLSTDIIKVLALMSSLQKEDEKNSAGVSGNVTLEVNNLSSYADAPAL